MGMTPRTVGIGIGIVALAATTAVLYIPVMTRPNAPSDIARPYTPLEQQGRQIYISIGCTYCHTQYIRPEDWDYDALRVSQPGDYFYDRPQLLGAHRMGPDLAQEGGLHPDDWHRAHFINPRQVRPASLMPRINFLKPYQLTALIAYVQGLGGKMADARVARQRYWKQQLVAAYASGPDNNVNFLHSHVPPEWMHLPNPYPATQESVAQGEFVYQQECIFCHGPLGDGNGPAAKYLNPPPFNFTLLKRHPWSGGMIYYQVMNGITGSAMPFFKEDLESAKIWDVANYIAVTFVGKGIDSNAPDNGIDAAEEPPRKPGTTEPPYLGPIPPVIEQNYTCCPPVPPKPGGGH